MLGTRNGKDHVGMVVVDQEEPSNVEGIVVQTLDTGDGEDHVEMDEGGQEESQAQCLPPW